MGECLACQSRSIKTLLDFGDQPVCSRFLVDRDALEYTHPLKFVLCLDCGLIQISEPFPLAEIFPRFDWITYREPERHLDDLALKINRLPGVERQSSIWGISYKDESLLERMERIGGYQIGCLDLHEHLKITEPSAGVETIQARLHPEAAKEIALENGFAKVVIARHILEHAYNPVQFVKSLKALVNDDGYVVIEVPDNDKQLETFDYTGLWEEHISYFTRDTLKRLMATAGFRVVRFESYDYPLENSLVGIFQPSEYAVASRLDRHVLDADRNRAVNFAERFPSKRLEIERMIKSIRRDKGRIVIFGAGHLSCKFVNLLGLGQLLDAYLDDNPNKIGLFMPGSRLPIYGSDYLAQQGVRVCLLGANPENDETIIRNKSYFLDDGGEFKSIFPGSRYALNDDVKS